MAFDPLTAILDIGGSLINKLFPDPAARDAAKLKMLELQQTGELEKIKLDLSVAMGQIETNKIEAASSSVFVSGWRPGAGWVCVAGLLYAFILQPLLTWISAMFHGPVPPLIDLTLLFELLLGMLGLGGMRSFEKVKGVASK